MIEQPRRASFITFWGLLLTIDWVLYFRHASHFFPGDAVFMLTHRGTTLWGCLREFVSLDGGGWFRPLSNELVASILYPFSGLHPIPYRIPVYIAFIAVTLCVYKLALQLTNRHLAASLATLFFTIHTVNAYTTYDIAFMPELLYGFFYVCGTLAFLHYLRHDNVRGYWLSVLCYIGALLSKESAVTMPGVLFLASICFTREPAPVTKRLTTALRTIVPHAIVLILYLAYAIGYLDVQGVSIARLFDQSQKPSFGDYTPVLNGGVLTDVKLAATWAFNIPRGWWGQWQVLSPGMLTYLKIFRVLTLVLLGVLLIRAERKIILFGIGWFWIAILPALPLATHFVPLYLFVPVVGLSLAVGLAFATAYDLLRPTQPAIAGVCIAVVFAGLLYVNSRSIRSDIRDNRILGGSARLASDTLDDIQHLYPVLPPGETLYFLDGSEPLSWEHDFGRLIKLAYKNEKINALYQSQGAERPDSPEFTVLTVRNGHLFLN